MSLPQQRSFNCHACKGIIYIPLNLPPTVAPCPHCGTQVSSPPPPNPFAATPVTLPPSPEVPSAPAVVIPPVRTRSAASDSSSGPSVSQSSSKASVFTPAFWIVALLLVAISCGGGWMLWNEYKSQQSLVVDQENEPNSDNEDYSKKLYYTEGWKIEAEATLSAFIKATTPEEKASHVIGGMETLTRLRKLYGEKVMTESLSSAETFYGVSVRGESEKTNIFLMTHHRPKQFCMNKFFRPLITSEKLHGIEELDDLTESLSNIEHFTMPRHTIQAYFKKTDQGMRLDWDIYAQTRFQTLKNFMEKTTAGSSQEFRVIIYQESISSENRHNKENFYYRVCDPAHIEDNFLISQRRDSSIVSELNKLHVVGSVSKETKIETATVVLEHDGNGNTHIKKFVCWEFAGLGGVSEALKAQSSAKDADAGN
jgi:hypothetical protein